MRSALRAAAAGVLGVLALYLAIWPHETGHAIAGWLVGCKKNWWTTDTSWFLWDSWGGPVDTACLHAKGLRAEAITDVGGIVVSARGASLSGRSSPGFWLRR